MHYQVHGSVNGVLLLCRMLHKMMHSIVKMGGRFSSSLAMTAWGSRRALREFGGNGSIGMLVVVLMVIIVLSLLAGFLARICDGQHIGGNMEYDFEGCIEKQCASCIDGSLTNTSPPPPPPPPTTLPTSLQLYLPQPNHLYPMSQSNNNTHASIPNLSPTINQATLTTGGGVPLVGSVGGSKKKKRHKSNREARAVKFAPVV